MVVVVVVVVVMVVVVVVVGVVITGLYYFITGLYDVPAGIIALLSIFYGTISILAVVGNFLVMWIVATSRRMQNVTNCFISNLALADIVIGLFAIPFQVNTQLQLTLRTRAKIAKSVIIFLPTSLNRLLL
jgi:hypothetical protein